MPGAVGSVGDNGAAAPGMLHVDETAPASAVLEHEFPFRANGGGGGNGVLETEESAATAAALDRGGAAGGNASNQRGRGARPLRAPNQNQPPGGAFAAGVGSGYGGTGQNPGSGQVVLPSRAFESLMLTFRSFADRNNGLSEDLLSTEPLTPSPPLLFFPPREARRFS